MRKFYTPVGILLLVAGWMVACVEDEGGEIPTFTDVYSNQSLVAFDSALIDEAHVKSYMIFASGLSGNVKVTLEDPSQKFALSKDGTSDFGSSLSYAPGEFQENKATVYVRFETAQAGVTHEASVTHTTENLVNPEVVQLEGLGIVDLANAPDISFSSTGIGFEALVAGDAAVQPYEITASRLEENLELSISGGPFTLSTAPDQGFGPGLSLSPAEFEAGPAAVYVKFEPAAAGSFEGSVVHTTAGLGFELELPLSGQAVADASELPQLVMSDDFSYDAGALPSTDRTGDGLQNEAIEGWIKVRTANAPIQVVDDGLSYSGYTGSGAGNAVKLDFNAPGSNSNIYVHNLSEQQDETFTGAYYASFLLRIDAFPADGQFNRPVMFVDWIEASGATDFLSAVQINNNAGDVKLGIKYRGVDGLSTFTPVIGTTYLVVLKHTVPDTDINNANNSASLYIFENDEIPSSEPASPLVTMNTPAGVGDDDFIKAITLVNDNSAAGAYMVDGIKVSTTWEDLFK